MAFTKALYYPTIGIPNEGWLKNAMLYWKEIYTIFPLVYRLERSQFYQTRTEQEFSDAGLLLPLEVYYRMPEIEELKDDVLKFLDTPEGKGVLGHQLQSHTVIQGLMEIHQDKFCQVPGKLNIKVRVNKGP